jgi:hypothetical protein
MGTGNGLHWNFPATSILQSRLKAEVQMGRRWTDQDVQQLKSMVQRYPAPKIAELTDRTVGGVTFKAHQLGLSLRTSREGATNPGSPEPGPAGFDWLAFTSRVHQGEGHPGTLTNRKTPHRARRGEGSGGSGAA